ncbi:MAG: twitching motility protein PilT [Desulfobacteraceae bacterium IS3]|nr:MAG: twitching motility protein PilT [Desulfobacteraceae bacterium IS3]
MIVADTHIIIWKALKPEMLSENAKKAIFSANRKEGIIFCEISLWEIAMLMQKKRIRVDSDYQDFIKLLMQSERYVLHGITPEIADCSVQFPPGVSKDPADRIIAATSVIEKAALVTADNSLRHAKNIKTIW